MIEVPFFQVGVLVPDIERAMDELGRSLGLTWAPVQRREVVGHPMTIVFSQQSEPYLELIEGPPGSPWDSGGKARTDHLAFWSDDLESDKRGLAERGAPIEIDGTLAGRPWTYHRAGASGLRIELIATSAREGILAAARC